MARHYRAMYQSGLWKQTRLHHLACHPLCEDCERRGLIVSATVVNHRVPHKGDWGLFSDPGNLQSLCKPCHDGAVQRQERLGLQFDLGTGADGMPSDPAHPFYRA